MCLIPFSVVLFLNADEALFDSEENTAKSCLLLQFILGCLYKIFLFDSHRFVSKERAESLMMPLVDQVLFSKFWLCS